jgi:outer membrane receptor protein involved in Fe transport
MKKILVLLLSCFLTTATWAQSNFGKLQGKVNDSKTKVPIAYATIILEKDGIRKGGAYTDEDGKYVINALDPGNYTVTVKYLDYSDKKVTDVDIFANGTKYLNIEMSQVSAEQGGGQALQQVVVRAGKPMIEKDNNSKTIGSKDITKLPTRSLNAIAGTTSGANQTSGGGISFLGSRTDATAYFVDGVRVLGSSSVPQSAQGQIEVIQSGVPAQYGDFTGGAIVITTKGPSRFVNRSFEMISSTLLDPYSYNQAEFSAVGPLWVKNKGGGKKEYVALGYQMAANFNYTVDASPGYGGFYSVKDDVLADLEQNPIIENPNGPLNVYRSLLLTEDDLEITKARKNVGRYVGNIQGKLEYQPNKNSTLTLFGSFNQSQGNNFSYDQSLMNYNRYSNSTNQTLRTYVKFTQRLGTTSEEDKEKKKSLFSDAFYNIRVDYQSRWQENQNLNHGTNFFDYGYIGKFTEYRKPFYQFQRTPTLHIDQNGDTSTRQNYFDLVGSFNTKIDFDPSDKNPIRANYTSQLFNEAEASGNEFVSTNQIQQALGLLNGFSPGYSYSLWANPGLGNNGYSKSQFERIAAYAQGEAILNLENTHDLQFGIYYEQTLFSSWSLGAGNLWTLMPLLANSHISNLDQVTENGYVIGGIHTYDDNGLFTDTVNYNIRIDKDQQKTFDRNLRAKLIADGATDVYGNPYTESSYIDINSLSPSTFSLDMFSAGDLWNNGNSFVGYFGYDYLGNRTRKAFSFTDFTNDDATKGIGSFSPISNAIWLQDKFQFKDLVLRLGVRVERYDGNQLGLKDQYSLFPTYSAGEIASIESGERGSNLLANYSIPQNIGDDYVVYVNDIESPSEIIGYRDGNKWFDGQGGEISSPDQLAQATKSGRIQPFLQSTDEELVPEAFQDYSPSINVLPRVMFSFPINSEALFFASYDKLAQRPQDGAIFAPINRYDYLEENQGGTLPNANLQPRVTTSYELGFKQTLTQNSALSLIAAYRSTIGDFALVQITQAYPITYNSYQNLDFETIKNFRAEYELRGLGRTSLGLNYSLLFADGTGSNINSAAALIQAGQPNLRSLYPTQRDIRHQLTAVLDYRFKGGNEYTGPIWFDKRVLQNFGANFIISAKSGEPYSAYINPIASAASGSAQRQSLDGNPFGSRLPWQFKIDANFSKNFDVKKKNPKDNFRRQSMQIQAFLWVQNLLNTRNIQRVYGFTGLANSDGWLSSPQGIQEANNAVNTQSYMALYNAKVESPYFYEIPRLVRLGLRVYF